MVNKQKILIVDDDANIAELISLYLTKECFDTMIVEDGESALRAVDTFAPNLILLDLMLPGEDGLQILRRLRASKDMTPVLMLTARGEDVDRIVGLLAQDLLDLGVGAVGRDVLTVGADENRSQRRTVRSGAVAADELADEVLARAEPGAPSLDKEVVVFGEFELDLGRRELRKNGETVSLTTGEFAVLKAFARHPRVPLSRDKLMEMARGREYEAFDRSLDVQVSPLRKLLEPDPSKPRYLQTVWGLGYVFIPDDPQDANKA